MPTIPERIDDLYERAKSGEPRIVALFVSDELDVIVQPASADSGAYIRLVDPGGCVAVAPEEVKDLVYYLVEAALMLAEWQSVVKE